MAKIVFMGAGSSVFVKNVVGDCMLSPVLKDSECMISIPFVWTIAAGC